MAMTVGSEMQIRDAHRRDEIFGMLCLVAGFFVGFAWDYSFGIIVWNPI